MNEESVKFITIVASEVGERVGIREKSTPRLMTIEVIDAQTEEAGGGEGGNDGRWQ